MQVCRSNPTCSRLEPRWSLWRVHSLDNTLAHSQPSIPAQQSLLELSIVHEAPSRGRNQIRTTGNTFSASHCYTMAEQILDQIRDVAEGQIVCLSCAPTSAPSLPYAETIFG